MDKCASPDRRDKQHAATMAENVQSALSKSTGQLQHHVGRRTGLPRPRLLDRSVQYVMRQMAAHRPADGHFLPATDQRGQIMRPKMPFRFHRRRKRRGIFFAWSCIGRHLSGFFFPAFDLRGVAYNLDLPLVIGKTHPAAETLLVKASQLRLITVMVGWPKKSPAQSAARHI